MLRSAHVVLALALVLPAGLTAQGMTTIRGLVLDSTILAPIPDVQVRVGLYGEGVTTDGDGVWVVRGVSTGPNTVIVEKEGYRTRIYRFSVPENVSPEIDVGVVYLTVGDNPSAPLFGRVRSQIEEPVVRASVLVDGNVATLTDDEGAFEIANLPIGVHELEFRRIGYVPKFATLQMHGTVEVNVTLDALPVELEEIVVDAERTVYASGRIREFYERRKTGLGRYLTRWEIEEKNPMFVTDLFRTIPGIRLVPGPFGSRRVVMTRNQCRPEIVLDGMPLDGVAIDNILIPDYIEGIEVYTGIATVPMMFSQTRACGAIVIWTR